ncbi:MAG: hypothetical protein IJ133_05215 [Clostridia bacterium]|nr:hypothetical protein [Clostridia bacterium]
MSIFKKKNTPVSGDAYEDKRVAENCKKVTLDNGTIIPYCEFGEENEEVIVTGAVYFITVNEFLKELAKKYHVYGFIMRIEENGTETEKNEDGSINWLRQWGLEIYESARKLGLNQYHYLGKCHGAMPGWYIAAEHPEALISLTSISASFHCSPQDQDQWTERQKTDGPKFALNAMRKKSNLPKKAAEAKTVGNTGFQGEGALAAMAKYGSHSEEVFFGDYDKCKEFYDNLKLPICYIFAVDDLLYYDFQTSNEYVLYHTNRGKFVMLDNERHLMEMDIPKKLAAECLFFLEETKMKDE